MSHNTTSDSTTVRPSSFNLWYNQKRTGVGSFEKTLYDLFFVASSSNRRRIVEAFPDFFNQADLNF